MAAPPRLVPALTRAGAPLPWAIALALALALAGCATSRGGVTGSVPEKPPDQVREQTGKASWYGKPHHGRRTASGQIYDMNALTAAHPSLPMGTRVVVTNLRNGRSVEVRIIDRGPIIRSRIVDLSYAAARELDGVSDGLFPVRVRVRSMPALGRASSL